MPDTKKQAAVGGTLNIGLIGQRGALMAITEGWDARGIWHPFLYESAAACIDDLKARAIDLIILDIAAHSHDGLDGLRDLMEIAHIPPVIVSAEAGSVRMAVDAMRHGAADFLIKPFDSARLAEAFSHAFETKTPHSLPAVLAGHYGDAPDRIPNPHNARNEAAAPHPGGFIGTSPPMQRVYDQIEHAAASRATVFITGESGTGKEVCAEAIHRLSPRARKPFIPINCAAIPRDLMESELFGHVKGAFTGAIADREGAASLANGGTLFLDEIAEMNPDMQTKLLRFLQNLTFTRVGGSRMEKTDVRVICATNRAPLEEVGAGRFREDLYYRLHVLPIQMPPLRQRGDDVTDLAHTFLRRYAAEEGKQFTGFAPGAEALMRRYSWPGNIRQLQNVLRQIVVMHDDTLVAPFMLPEELRADGHERHFSVVGGNAEPLASRAALRTLEEVERDAIETAIATFGGNIPRAAAALGVSPSTLYRKKAAWEGAGDDGREGADSQENQGDAPGNTPGGRFFP